jgi:hypothetical protein
MLLNLVTFCFFFFFVFFVFLFFFCFFVFFFLFFFFFCFFVCKPHIQKTKKFVFCLLVTLLKFKFCFLIAYNKRWPEWASVVPQKLTHFCETNMIFWQLLAEEIAVCSDNYTNNRRRSQELCLGASRTPKARVRTPKARVQGAEGAEGVGCGEGCSSPRWREGYTPSPENF